MHVIKYGRGEEWIQLWWKNLRGEGHADDLSVDGYNNIKTNFCALEWDVVDEICVAEYRHQFLVNGFMELEVQWKVKIVPKWSKVSLLNRTTFNRVSFTKSALINHHTR
jgi:hypothetical protein